MHLSKSELSKIKKEDKLTIDQMRERDKLTPRELKQEGKITVDEAKDLTPESTLIPERGTGTLRSFEKSEHPEERRERGARVRGSNGGAGGGR